MASDGKQLEQLAFLIQKSIAPEALVTLNDRILGKLSKSKRQIDISVKQRIGLAEILVIVECKDYSNKVDVKDLESFGGVISDTKANKGIMVSRLGFTSGAINLAKETGIDLYSLDNIIEENGIENIQIPVLANFIGIESMQWTMSATGPIRIPANLGDPDIPLYTKEGKPLPSALTLLHQNWNDGRISRECKVIDNLLIAPESKYCVKDYKDNIYYPINVHVRLVVRASYFYGQIEMESFKYYKDEIKGEVVGKIFRSETMSYEIIAKKWKRVEDPKSLKINPEFSFKAEDYYKI